MEATQEVIIIHKCYMGAKLAKLKQDTEEIFKKIICSLVTMQAYRAMDPRTGITTKPSFP